jgi:hypothetical protein
MADIFLSYARADVVPAKAIADRLLALGFSVFYDQRIPTGDAWDQRIEHELSLASAVIVLWSMSSRERPWVRNEAREGLKRGILLPASLDDCEIPLEFRHVQTTALQGFENEPEHLGWSKLQNDICTLLKGGTRLSSIPEARNINDASIHAHDDLASMLKAARGAQASRDISSLHPEVRRAVEAARRAELAAIDARHRAQLAADRAEDRARAARNGMSGVAVQRIADGDLYEGEITGRFPLTFMNGYGVRTMSGPGPHKGDRYAGHFMDGNASGSGIYTYGRNANNKPKSLQYEGDFARGMKSGFGYFCWRSGDYSLGAFSDDVVHGAGVHYFNDGRCHEGYSADWFADGYGVEWQPDGSARAGIWSRNRLITPK